MCRLLPLLSVLLVACAAGSRSDVAWSPADSDLLFASNHHGNMEIYRMPAGDSEWIALTRHDAVDNWPDASPDGRWVVFQSRRSGNLDLWSMRIDGSGLRHLTDDAEPDYLPAWSPDGKRIVFTSWRREPGDTERQPHLYVMNADGSAQQRLPIESLQTSSGASWSPDGGRIVYSRASGEEGANLFVANSDGSNERQITSGEQTYHGSPTFSPDGRRIACYADDGKGSALLVMNADGSDVRTLLGPGKNWYPRWSPDGRWLIFTRGTDSDEDIDIAAVPVDGGELQVLVSGPRREQEGSWVRAPH